MKPTPYTKSDSKDNWRVSIVVDWCASIETISLWPTLLFIDRVSKPVALYYLYCYIILLLGVAEIRTFLWVVLI
nr:MAG TPA: hypothetical protein [Caudoviricetes sp.]